MGALNGYSILITGGGSGIGLAVVKRFLDEGAVITVLEKSPKGIDHLHKAFGKEVQVCEGDVTVYADNAKAVDMAVSRHGKLDVFVGNAGIYDFNAPLNDTAPEELENYFRQIFDVNVKGYLLGAKAAVEHLKQSKGSMIFSASSSSLYAGGGGAVYVASKHAVVGLVRQLAFELAPDIRVNAVAPGGTLTDLGGISMADGTRKHLSGIDGFSEMVSKTVPLGRVAEAADHTGIYLLLASRELSGFMTAAIIPSDGGLEVRGGGRKRNKG